MLHALLQKAKAKTQAAQLELQAELQAVLEGPHAQTQTQQTQSHESLQEEIERQLNAEQTQQGEHMLEEHSQSPTIETGSQPAISPSPVSRSAQQQRSHTNAQPAAAAATDTKERTAKPLAASLSPTLSKNVRFKQAEQRGEQKSSPSPSRSVTQQTAALQSRQLERDG